MAEMRPALDFLFTNPVGASERPTGLRPLDGLTVNRNQRTQPSRSSTPRLAARVLPPPLVSRSFSGWRRLACGKSRAIRG
jgi:hypothetical protein